MSEEPASTAGASASAPAEDTALAILADDWRNVPLSVLRLVIMTLTSAEENDGRETGQAELAALRCCVDYVKCELCELLTRTEGFDGERLRRLIEAAPAVRDSPLLDPRA